MELVPWVRMTANSINALSRTTNGVGDVSLAKGKPKLAIADGENLALIAAQNLDQALRYAWISRRKPLRAAGVRSFIDHLVSKVNEKLVPKDQSCFREWSVEYSGPVAPTYVSAAYTAFCENLADKLPRRTDVVGAVKVAAWSERELDWRIHPFSDGCGRVSRILGAWVLLRSDLPPALLNDRAHMYEKMNDSEAAWLTYYRGQVSARMSQY